MSEIRYGPMPCPWARERHLRHLHLRPGRHRVGIELRVEQNHCFPHLLPLERRELIGLVLQSADAGVDLRVLLHLFQLRPDEQTVRIGGSGSGVVKTHVTGLTAGPPPV